MRAAINNVAANLRAPNNNVQPLRGGDWRMVYDLDHRTRTITVRAIGQRGGATRP